MKLKVIAQKKESKVQLKICRAVIKESVTLLDFCMTQERRPCEAAGSQSCRHPAAAETACRTRTCRRACCRLHEQRPDAHFLYVKEKEALHQCHRSVIW